MDSLERGESTPNLSHSGSFNMERGSSGRSERKRLEDQMSEEFKNLDPLERNRVNVPGLIRVFIRLRDGPNLVPCFHQSFILKLQRHW